MWSMDDLTVQASRSNVSRLTEDIYLLNIYCLENDSTFHRCEPATSCQIIISGGLLVFKIM